MYHYKRPKHLTRRFVKKYTKSIVKQDPSFRGIFVYTYYINDAVYFTAKPKQKNSKAYPLKYVCWMKKNNYDICRSSI